MPLVPGSGVGSPQGPSGVIDLRTIQEILQALAKLKSGAWTPVEELSVKLENENLEARTELGGSVLRIRGNAVVKAGQTIETPNLVFVLPPGIRPSVARFGVCQNASTGEAKRCTIQASGRVEWYGTAAPAGNVISFELTVSM